MFGLKARQKASRARKRFLAAMTKLPRFPNKTGQVEAESTDAGISNGLVLPPLATPIVTTELRVSVVARFEAPLDKNITNSYEASPTFEATEEVCQALLRRIEHCSHELITRPDAQALNGLRFTDPRMKVARFHLSFRIDRRGQPWAERFFTSFQDVALGIDAAHEVVLEADRIVCQFLRAHDAGFEWELPAIVKEDPLKQRTASHEIGAPQAIHCVPSYEGTPGYSIELSVRTCCRGQSRDWHVKVDSYQLTPLTLPMGEKLMSQISAILRQAIKHREDRFDEIHQYCTSLESTFGCQHFAEGAFDVVAKIQNNIGPDYPHLSTRFQSYRILLHQGTGTAFVQDLEAQINTARDVSDNRINRTDDIVLAIQELRSKDWKVYHPLSVTLDASIMQCRITTERIIERVQSGLAHVLRGHGTVAALTIHKRGHLVLETTVCRGEDTDFYDLELFDSLNLKKRVLQKRIVQQLREDIAMVCKDTISLHSPQHVPELKIVTPDDLIVEPLLTRANAFKKGLPAPTRRISKKSRLPNLRRRSLEEEEEEKEGASSQPTQQGIGEHSVQDYGYMADMVSERSDSVHIPTPSLADTASDYLPEGANTPQSALASHNDYATPGLGIMSLDYDHGQTAETPSLASEVGQSSVGTIIHHAQPSVKKATTLLASYWEECDSDSSRLEETTSDVFENISQKSDTATNGTQTRDTSYVTNNNKSASASDMIAETAWLANKASFGVVNRTQDSAEHGHISLDSVSGGASTHKHPVVPKVAAVVASSAGLKSSAALPRSHTMPALSIGHQTTSRALIVQGSEKRLNCFPRRSSAEAAPAHTLVPAQGLVHKRQFSYPAGGHLGLHGEWSIEMGLRNALVPSHLRTALARSGAAKPPKRLSGLQSSNKQ